MSEYSDLPLFREPPRPAVDEPENGPPLPSPMRFGNLSAAQEWLRERLRDGAECPCCGQFAKIYKRKLNSAMARTMILMHKEARRDGEKWIHLLQLYNRSGFYSGDYGHLVSWGMLESKAEQKDDGNPGTGLYRITHDGTMFTLQRTQAPAYAFFYNKQLLGFSTKMIGIREALGSKFTYTELMRS